MTLRVVELPAGSKENGNVVLSKLTDPNVTAGGGKGLFSSSLSSLDGGEVGGNVLFIGPNANGSGVSSLKRTDPSANMGDVAKVASSATPIRGDLLTLTAESAKDGREATLLTPADPNMKTGAMERMMAS
jgi:hypothetical protein